MQQRGHRPAGRRLGRAAGVRDRLGRPELRPSSSSSSASHVWPRGPAPGWGRHRLAVHRVDRGTARGRSLFPPGRRFLQSRERHAIAEATAHRSCVALAVQYRRRGRPGRRRSATGPPTTRPTTQPRRCPSRPRSPSAPAGRPARPRRPSTCRPCRCWPARPTGSTSGTPGTSATPPAARLVTDPRTGQPVDLDTALTGPVAAYLYERPGTYTVTLTRTTAAGATLTYRAAVVVPPAARTVAVRRPGRQRRQPRHRPGPPAGDRRRGGGQAAGPHGRPAPPRRRLPDGRPTCRSSTPTCSSTATATPRCRCRCCGRPTRPRPRPATPRRSPPGPARRPT